MTDDTITIKSRKHGERIFRRIGQRPYRRKDGADTTLAVWEGRCVVCGEPFELVTPLRASKNSGSFGRVSCLAHRRARALQASE